MKHYPTVLSIAGSDSIGGAGIQADIKTCCHFNVFAMTAITAVTAQNTCGVQSFEAMSGDFVKRQIDSVVTDVRPDAVKIGMLPNPEVIKAVAESLSKYSLTNVVLDPVLVATSGDSLTENNDTKSALIDYLMPLATVITPNIPETEALLGRKLTNRMDDAVDLAAKLNGNCAVLLKGGHGLVENGKSIDMLYDPSTAKFTEYTGKWCDSRNTHGTGCSLSSAIACGLALGKPLTEAVSDAKRFITDAIAKGKDYEFGNGHGPIYFF